jgi:hypothetical protein
MTSDDFEHAQAVAEEWQSLQLNEWEYVLFVAASCMDLRCTMFIRQIRWLGQLGSHDSRHTMFSRTVSLRRARHVSTEK